MASNSMRHIPAEAPYAIHRRAIVALNNGFEQVEVSALGPRQMKRIESLVLGKMPDQLRLPFYLWSPNRSMTLNSASV